LNYQNYLNYPGTLAQQHIMTGLNHIIGDDTTCHLMIDLNRIRESIQNTTRLKRTEVIKEIHCLISHN